MSDMPQLERALVDAARRRARRAPRPALRWAVGLAAAVLAVVLVVRGAGPDHERTAEPPPAPPAPALDDAVGRVLSATLDEPACALSDGRSRLVSEPASAATRGAFGLLRRVQRPGEQYPRQWQKTPLAGAEVLSPTARRPRAADGSLYLVAISRGPYPMETRDAEACGALRRAAFDRLAGGLSDAERRRGHAALESSLRDDGGAGPNQEHVEFYVLNPDGTPNDAGTAPVEAVRRDGLYRVKLLGRTDIERQIGGIVPDGVAEVAVRYRAQDGSVAIARGPVRDNVLHVVLPLGAARRVTISWRDAAGRELRRVPFSAG